MGLHEGRVLALEFFRAMGLGPPNSLPVKNGLKMNICITLAQ